MILQKPLGGFRWSLEGHEWKFSRNHNGIVGEIIATLANISGPK